MIDSEHYKDEFTGKKSFRVITRNPGSDTVHTYIIKWIDDSWIVSDRYKTRKGQQVPVSCESTRYVREHMKERYDVELTN